MRDSIIFLTVGIVIALLFIALNFRELILRYLKTNFGPTIPSKDDALRIGILGAAAIAPNAVILPARRQAGVFIAAVAARDKAKAKRFAHRWGIPKVHDTYDDLINDPSIDAIFNPLPNSLHKEWTIKALRKGKHVLCEKPFANNEQECLDMHEVAQRHQLVLVEAFHSRFHPVALFMKNMIDSGKLGKLVRVDARLNIPFFWFGRDDIRYDAHLGGGATMDLGCYCIMMLRYLTGFEPEVTHAEADKYTPEIDEGMRATFKFPHGLKGQMRVSYRHWFFQPPRIIVEGEKARMECLNFVAPHIWHRVTITALDGNSKAEVSNVYGTGESTYFYQLMAFAKEIKDAKQSHPHHHGKSNDLPTLPPYRCPTTALDAAATMRVVDEMYRKAGMHPRGLKES